MAEKTVIIRKSVVKAILKGNLQQKQQVSSGFVDGINDLVLGLINDIARQVGNYESFPFPKLKAYQVDDLCKRWLDAHQLSLRLAKYDALVEMLKHSIREYELGKEIEQASALNKAKED